MWKRVSLLVVFLFALFFVGAAEFGLVKGADSKELIAAVKGKVLAALEDPLALLGERSPGRRGAGYLHLTKSIPRPHERVLSEVRKRPLPPGLTPAAGNPAFGDDASPTTNPPGDEPGDNYGDQGSAPPNSPLALNSPVGFPGIPIGGGGNPGKSSDSPGGTGGANIPPNNPSGPQTPGGPVVDNTPGNPGNTAPPGSDLPPGGNGPPGGNIDTPPGGNDIPPGFDTPPGGNDNPPGGIDSPPGNPNNPDQPIPVPEPATWALMVFGLLALFAAASRNTRRRNRGH